MAPHLSRTVATIRRECGQSTGSQQSGLRAVSGPCPTAPTAGRKPSREVAVATSLRRKGVQWRAIYRKLWRATPVCRSMNETTAATTSAARWPLA